MTPYVVAGMLAALVALACGGPVILWLTRAGKIKPVREDAPRRHTEKAGTPTLGGLLILGAAAVAVLVVVGKWGGAGRDLAVALGVIGWFAFVGWIDDVRGIGRGRNLGLRAREKLALQIPVALALGAYAVWQPSLGSGLTLPSAHLRIDLAWAYLLFCLLFVIGMANAVNLTDGLDGLAAGSVAISAGSLVILTVHAGAFLMGVICAAFAGAALGFLWFNAYPARIFMGDVGSQALGAALAVVGVLAKAELIVLIVGGLFVAEALSVILQVGYFRMTGRRLFRMSPIHHHFELSGWTETQTVVRFWVCGALLAALGVGLGS
jgi:phospho-N-acetylmuramoyl-pentapeptide-transferase